MANKNYIKGYRLERRVMKRLEEDGYFVRRSGKSAFPDIIAVRPLITTKTLLTEDGVASVEVPTYAFEVMLIECKYNKYISREEKIKAKELISKYHIPFFVYWNNNHKLDWYEVTSGY